MTSSQLVDGAQPSVAWKPRVVMLQLEYYPIFSGHAVYLRHLIEKMREKGCDVVILAADFHELPHYEVLHGTEVFRFKFSTNNKFKELKLALRVVVFLIKNRHRFDLLHINGHLDVYGILTIMNKIMRKRTVMQMVLLGGDDPLSIAKSYKFMSIRFKILAFMDQFLCISRAIADSYKKVGLPVKKLSYITQGVDVQRFNPADKQLKLSLKRKFGLSAYQQIVVFVGAIVERKGIDLLVRAWKMVQEKYPEALLLLVGQDKFGKEDVNKNHLELYVEKIRSIIRDNSSNVIFAGRQENVDEYFKSADVFVLPSRNEGFGNVILEAMACGLPVVVTYMDGVSGETVSNGVNGFVVNNETELADSIIRLFGDRNLAEEMGRVGRHRACRDFSLTNIAQKYVDLYRELIVGSSGR